MLMKIRKSLTVALGILCAPLFTAGVALAAQNGGAEKVCTAFAAQESPSDAAACVTAAEETPVYYGTVEEAWAAADGKILKLLADATVEQTLEVAEGGNITLDLNGYMLRYDSQTDGTVIKIKGTFTLEDSYEGTDRVHAVDNPVTDDPSDTVDIVGGVITGGHNSWRGGGVFVQGGNVCGTFIMNGGTIAGNKSEYDGADNYAHGGGVFLDVGGSFTMNGGSISYNKAWGQIAGIGGGVFSYQPTAKITGGIISHNKSNYQGGGFHAENGSLVFEGGVISDNESLYGGGMSLVNVATTMRASQTAGTVAKVENNVADYGGGIYFYKGTFILEDGVISGNQARNAGGLYVQGDGENGEFLVKGGEISKNSATNQAGGIYYSSGTLGVEGKVNITGNKKGEEDNNLYVVYNTNTQVSRIVKVTGLLDGARIGFNLRAGHIGTFTSGYTSTGNTAAPGKYFISDGGNCVLTDGGEVKVSTSVHEAGEWITDKEAEIDVAGSRHKQCKNCEYVMQTEEIEALVGKLEKPAVGGGENIAVVTTPNGFTSDIELAVTEIARENYGAYQTIADNANGIINLVYDVTLKSDGVAIQPDGMLTVKLLIPAELRGKNFKLFHLHESQTVDTQYEVEGNYAVITCDKLSEFIFVGEKSGTSPDNRGLSAGAMAGIIAGSILLVLLAAYVTLYFTLYRKGAVSGKFFDAVYAPMNAIFGKKKNGGDNVGD